MKALGIDQVERFPFPTAPPTNAVRNAVALLTNLGAITPYSSSKTQAGNTDGKSEAARLSAEIAMATMSAMKSGSALHQKQLLD